MNSDNNLARSYMARNALDFIADILSEPGKPWDSETLEQIHDILTEARRYVPDNADTNEIYLRRTTCLVARDLPEECIAACSGSGDVSGAVAYWRETLPFGVHPDAARECLAGYGAWEDLDEVPPETLAERVLWIACCDFAEYQRGGPDCGSDVFSLGG